MPQSPDAVEKSINTGGEGQAAPRPAARWFHKLPGVARVLGAATVAVTVAQGMTPQNAEARTMLSPEGVTQEDTLTPSSSVALEGDNLILKPAVLQDSIGSTGTATAPDKSPVPNANPSLENVSPPTPSESAAPAPRGPEVTTQATPIPENNLAIQGKPNKEIVEKAKALYPDLLTVVGYTTDTEVQKLGPDKVKNVQSFPDGTKIYTLNSPSGKGDNQILTKGGVVISEKALTLDKNGVHPNGKEFIPALGKVDTKNWLPGADAKLNMGMNGTTYLWPDKGVALTVNLSNNQVWEIQTFAPMTKQEYLGNFGQVIAFNR